MRNWRAYAWLSVLALLPLGIAYGGKYAASAAPRGATAADAATAAVDELPPGVGSLTVQWTISGRREPLDCGGLGIDRFRVSLTAVGGTATEPWDAPCDAFQTSLDLSPGAYSGEAVMVDRLDRPVTLSLPLDEVEVVAGREALVAIDFPMAAFL